MQCKDPLYEYFEACCCRGLTDFLSDQVLYTDSCVFLTRDRAFAALFSEEIDLQLQQYFGSTFCGRTVMPGVCACDLVPLKSKVEHLDWRTIDPFLLWDPHPSVNVLCCPCCLKHHPCLPVLVEKLAAHQLSASARETSFADLLSFPPAVATKRVTL